MRTVFNGETYEVRTLLLQPGYIRVDDFIIYKGELMQVITVQHNVPRIENISHTFHMITLKDKDGNIVPADDIVNPRNVIRPIKKFKKVPA